ncbi:MAG: DUF3501 family protein [bacterium]
MSHLTRDNLWSLEEYAAERDAFRAKVMSHKKNRQLALGDHARLYFEDELTIRYQIQEMLRIEKVFEADGIQEELDAYNPLIPDGRNWKATFMLEYGDAEERRMKVVELLGIEDSVWMQVEGFSPVYAIADEDLERDDGEKTSTVHFLRFELTDEMVAAAKNGAPINAGVDHSGLPVCLKGIPENIRASLVDDLSETVVH